MASNKLEKEQDFWDMRLFLLLMGKRVSWTNCCCCCSSSSSSWSCSLDINALGDEVKAWDFL